jgi:hypothetical protein
MEKPTKRSTATVASQRKHPAVQHGSVLSLRRHPKGTSSPRPQSTGSRSAAETPQLTFIQADSQGRSPADVRRLIRRQCMVGKNTGKRKKRNAVIERPGDDTRKSDILLPDKQSWAAANRVDVTISSSCTACLLQPDNAIPGVAFLTTHLPGPFRALPTLLIHPFSEWVESAEQRLLMDCMQSMRNDSA